MPVVLSRSAAGTPLVRVVSEGVVMKVRRLGSALAAVAMATVFAVAVPSSASAAEYPPVVPPVEVLPDTPAEWAATIDTLTPEEAALRKLQIQAGGLSAAEKTRLNLNGVLTKMSAIQRGNTVLAAGSAGFLVGAGGARLVIAAIGADWDESMCSLPPVVRDGYALMSLGVGAATCAQPVLTPNADQPAHYSTVTYGGFSISHSASKPRTPSGVSHCYAYSGSYSGFRGQWLVDGVWTSYNFVTGSLCGTSGQIVNSFSTDVGAAVRVITSTGEVVGTMTESRADPERQYRGRATHVGGGTSNCSFIVKNHELQGLPLGDWADACGTVGADKTEPIERMTLEEYDPDAGSWTPILDVPLDTAAVERMEDYPDCYDGSQQCTLTLRAVKGTATNECLTGSPGACASWWTDTMQGTQPVTADGTQYECRWGSYPVALERCAVYQKSFTATETGVGVITDPTGTPLPSEATGSTSPNTINPGALVGTPAGECMASWFDDFNPIDWVLTPIKCAFVWAFIPRPEVVTQVQTTVAEAWAPTIVGRLPAVVAGAVVVPDGGTGCSGPYVDLPINIGGMHSGYQGYPFSACDEPMSTLAGWARLIGSALLIWATGLGIIRRGSAVVNAPGLGGS